MPNPTKSPEQDFKTCKANVMVKDVSIGDKASPTSIRFACEASSLRLADALTKKGPLLFPKRSAALSEKVRCFCPKGPLLFLKRSAAFSEKVRTAVTIALSPICHKTTICIILNDGIVSHHLLFSCRYLVCLCNLT